MWRGRAEYDKRLPMSSADPTDSSPKTGSFLLQLLRDWGVALVVVLVVFAGYNVLFGPKAPALGPAPDFVLQDLEGRSVTLSQIDDKPVILNFWFTTCPPCRAEIPELSKFHAEHPEVPIYGVSTDINLATPQLKKASDRLGVRYPVLHDMRAEVAQKYGVGVFPTTLVIHDGQIINARVGAVDRAILESMLP
jgi:thiol-disulfide isomerase/thioredoxin